ncbi:MAG: hypothetical protein J6P71_02380 [Oscillospiraceae bacterium]|nr:hypothetical protein [Oscillospiraceae bacterium]
MSSLLSALMASGGREAISGREDGLEKLAGSGAGMKVGRMVGADEELKKALERGDAETVKKRVSALSLAREGGAAGARRHE